MIEFIKSPMYQNWFTNHIPTESLIICSPFIKQHAVDKVFEDYNLAEKISNIDFKILIRGTSDDFISNSSSDLSVLDSFITLNGFDINNVRRISNLHMKAYLVDGKDILITSGNFTNRGIFVTDGHENFEGGIYTDEPSVINDFLDYFNLIWNQSEALDVFYDTVMNDYNTYITNHDTKSIVHRKTKSTRYFFDFIAPETISTPSHDYMLYDLPPAGNIKYIDPAVKILIENNRPLSYIELGSNLRHLLGKIKPGETDAEAKVNNNKFGEEKGKFLVYLNLATLSYNSPAQFYLTALGKTYFNTDDETKEKILTDQIVSKEIVMEVYQQRNNDDFKLNTYIENLHLDAKKSTIDRRRGALQNLVDYITKL